LSEEFLPGFTVLMPTLNSEGRIRRCLDSIRGQDYPQDRIDILVADGGSTDGTRQIAESYGATVVDNPLRLAEEGLRIGMSRVHRDHVMIFADDNELAGSDWLSTVAGIFEAEEGLCAFFCRLGASEDDPDINKYYALVESEPLNFYMNRNLKKYIDASPARECGRIDYHTFDVQPKKPLVWGANGLVFLTEAIKPVWNTGEYLGDTDAFQLMLEKGCDRVAYSRDLCVYHHHVGSLWSWRKKWSRNFQQHFLTNIDTRNLDWLFVPHFKARLFAWTLYSIIPVVSVPLALARAFRDRDWHWLYHPAAAFLQAWTYITIILFTKEGHDYLFRGFRAKPERNGTAPRK
jgi:glycosyltransferase involved in cell wall biosynthesis